MGVRWDWDGRPPGRERGPRDCRLAFRVPPALYTGFNTWARVCVCLRGLVCVFVCRWRLSSFCGRCWCWSRWSTLPARLYIYKGGGLYLLLATMAVTSDHSAAQSPVSTMSVRLRLSSQSSEAAWNIERGIHVVHGSPSSSAPPRPPAKPGARVAVSHAAGRICSRMAAAACAHECCWQPTVSPPCPRPDSHPTLTGAN